MHLLWLRKEPGSRFLGIVLCCISGGHEIVMVVCLFEVLLDPPFRQSPIRNVVVASQSVLRAPTRQSIMIAFAALLVDSL